MLHRRDLPSRRNRATFLTGGDRGARRGRHFNNDKPVVVNADLAADRPVTIFRLWHAEGGLCMTGVEGQTATPRRPLLGTNGLVAVDDRDVGEWFDELVHAGMPHHLLLLPGRHAESLRRLGRMLNAIWIG